MLVSPDPADPRYAGSCLSLPASISVVTIPDPQVHSTQVILSSSFIILKHLCHHPRSFLNHISRHGQEAESCIIIHFRYHQLFHSQYLVIVILYIFCSLNINQLLPRVPSLYVLYSHPRLNPQILKLRHLALRVGVAHKLSYPDLV